MLQTLTVWLAPLYRAWMKFAHILGVVNGTIILTILFVVLIGPIATLRRLYQLFAWLFLIAPKEQTRWKPKRVRPVTLDEVSRFF